MSARRKRPKGVVLVLTDEQQAALAPLYAALNERMNWQDGPTYCALLVAQPHSSIEASDAAGTMRVGFLFPCEAAVVAALLRLVKVSKP